MRGKMAMALGMALLMAGLAGCIEDMSAPNRRVDASGRWIEDREKTNAERRTTETPKTPAAGTGKEFPGQSRGVEATSSMLTLGDMPGCARCGKGAGCVCQGGMSDRQAFAVPGKTMVVPGTGYAILPEWGTGPALVNYPHRPWGDKQATYLSGETKHNPVYWSNAYEHAYQPATGQRWQWASWRRDYVEVPWFYAQSVAVPVLMCLHQPLGQTTTRSPAGAAYQGALPAGGPVDPAPVAGEIKYVYPFTATQPAGTVPATMPFEGK